MRFASHTIADKTITDPMTKAQKVVKVLVFQVVEEDSRKVNKVYSITSEKHAQQFAPYLIGNGYLGRLFTITAQGRGFLREYTTKVE